MTTGNTRARRASAPRRIGTAALCAAATTMGLAVSGPAAGASRRPALDPVIAAPGVWAGRAVAGAAAGSRATVGPDSTCYSQNGSDQHGDNPTADATSYALSFDCATKAWKMSTTTVAALASSNLAGFALEIDNDGNFTDHCNGIDERVIGGWDGHALVGQVQTVTACDNVTVAGSASASRPSSKAVQVVFSNASIGSLSTFTWREDLGAISSQDVDLMPDSGPLTAAHYLPTGFTSGPALTINAVATKVVSGDFNGDGRSDVFYWGAGTKPDYLRLGQANGTFAAGPAISAGGAFSSIVSGDFNGDGRDDLFYYAKGTSPDYLRLGQANGTFVPGPGIAINGYYDAVVPGDFNGDTFSDLLFYGKGTKGDLMRLGSVSGGFTVGPAPVINTAFTELVSGDVNGDGRTDVVFYGSGSAPDAIKLGQTNGTLTLGPTLSVSGVYPQLAMGDYDGDGHADVAYYVPGTAPDALKYGTAGATFLTKTSFSVDGTYLMIAGDYNGDGKSDLLEYGSGTAADHLSLGHTPS